MNWADAQQLAQHDRDIREIKIVVEAAIKTIGILTDTLLEQKAEIDQLRKDLNRLDPGQPV